MLPGVAIVLIVMFRIPAADCKDYTDCTRYDGSVRIFSITGTGPTTCAGAGIQASSATGIGAPASAGPSASASRNTLTIGSIRGTGESSATRITGFLQVPDIKIGVTITIGTSLTFRNPGLIVTIGTLDSSIPIVSMASMIPIIQMVGVVGAGRVVPVG